jgi:hypothetical protein
MSRQRHSTPPLNRYPLWRLAGGLCVSWIVMIASLVAIPGLRLASVVVFCVLLIALGISLTLAGRPADARATAAETASPSSGASSRDRAAA